MIIVAKRTFLAMILQIKQRHVHWQDILQLNNTLLYCKLRKKMSKSIKQSILIYICHIYCMLMVVYLWWANTSLLMCWLDWLVQWCLPTLLEAISLTERCVCMVSSWSKHQSSSSSVSRASCWYCWSDSDALGLTHTPPRGDLLRTQQLVS